MYHINGTLRVVPTFREFVSYLVSRPPEEYDPHWRPVSLQCGLCHINYTAVVLTETYNEDIRYVMRCVSPVLLLLLSYCPILNYCIVCVYHECVARAALHSHADLSDYPFSEVSLNKRIIFLL